MQEQLITLETAKIAKDKGFVGSTTYEYKSADCINHREYIPHDYNSRGLLSAPTQSHLQKWLREKHYINLLVNLETIDDSETAYTWHIKQYIEEGNNRKKDTWDFYEDLYSFSADRMQWFDTYEQALEDGLREALKLVTV